MGSVEKLREDLVGGVTRTFKRISQEGKDGLLQLKLWSELWAKGKIHKEVVRLLGLTDHYPEYGGGG